jgi:hypothetical protein
MYDVVDASKSWIRTAEVKGGNKRSLPGVYRQLGDRTRLHVGTPQQLLPMPPSQVLMGGNHRIKGANTKCFWSHT